MLKQQLNIKLQQKISPMQMQVIKMLEYPTVELEQKINDELMDNPALEAASEDGKNDDGLDDFVGSESDASLTPDADWAWNGDNDDIPDDIPSYRLNTNNHSAEDSTYSREQTSGPDLAEYLTDQLNMLDTDEHTRQLCQYIIGNIDGDGYLRRDIEKLVDDMTLTAGGSVSDGDMLNALQIIQTLDPLGVGARDLRECLSIQLRAIEPEFRTKATAVALRIVDKYFDLLAKKQFGLLTQRIGTDHDTIEEALRIIRRLNPNPGANFGNGMLSSVQTITPDFIVENNGRDITVALNNHNIPELRVNPEFSLMVNELSNSKNQTRERRDAMMFAKQKMESARWFIELINQRNNTLISTMRTIVDMQREFFLTGDDKQLRPMRLKDVAERTGFDISTISRVSSSKYVDTEWGVIPLKHFFSEGMATHEGEEVSTKEIKLIIREAIEAEDKQNPIADDKLTELLNKKGYKIARRTVAKYREQLNIPMARLRRQF